MLKSYLIVFFISMLPLIELRGAIPVGIGMGLPILPTYLVCVVGNMLPVPFIYLFAGYRRMDRYAGCVHPRYEVQRCAHRLHGRRAAGRDHHGSGKRRSFGSAERSVCGVRLVFHRKVC